MDSYIKAITLDVNADENFTIIKAKQGDKINRKLAITLKKDGVDFTPTGVAEIWFRMEKPDKNIAIVKSTDTGSPISVSGNVYTVTLSEQCLTASGKAWCDLAFIDSSGDILSSCAFIMNIVPMPNGNTAESVSEWTDLQNAIDDAERFAAILAFRVSDGYLQYTIDGTTWVNLMPTSSIGGCGSDDITNNSNVTGTNVTEALNNCATDVLIETVSGVTKLKQIKNGLKYPVVEVEDVPTDTSTKLPSSKALKKVLGDFASEFSSSATYAVGARCIYNGVLYECTTAVTTAGAWTGSTNWTARTVDYFLGDLKGAITALEKVVGKTDTAGFHNSIYRGKSLGTSYTTAQHNAIVAGTFDDMYIGDYWTIGGIDYVICHFDYYYYCSDANIDYHHVVVMPRGVMTGLTVTKTPAETSDGYYQWNETNTTSGGYTASRMRTVIMPACDTKVKAAFGSSYVKPISELYPTSYDSTSGRATGWGWTSTTSTNLACDLCNETMVYGAQVWSISNDGRPGYEVGIDKWQLAIFALHPAFANIRAGWWLRSVDSSTDAAFVGNGGDAGNYGSSAARGVRPRFLLS